VTKRRLNVVVVSGGPSRERGVSVKSGAAVGAALASLGHRVLPVTIGTDRRWARPAADAPPLPEGESALARPPAAALAELSAGAAEQTIDVVFVALHGAFGEDGTVQGFLETAGVPYTGSGVAASAVAMDKERTKEVLSHHGLATSPWASVDRHAWEEDHARALSRIETAVGYPAVVKMPREGSSFGVTLVADREQLVRAIGEAVGGPEGRALVERRVAGTEVTCPVLGNRGGRLTALPLVEIVPKGRDFFDFEAKYEGHSAEICPARVTAEVAARVREAAMTAHRVLGCDGMSRSDFIVDADGRPWFLETNTVPGMTEQSLCPLSARAAGIEFPRLCEMLVELAVERAASQR
jgi:D-alanine-D-alanine ligase